MNVRTNPLTQGQLAALEQVVSTLTPDQILWLSGYLEGRLAAILPNGTNLPEVEAAVVQEEKNVNLTILFGTDTGRSEALAKHLADKATQKNIQAQVVSMYDYNPRKLKEEENVAVIISTHGEGEPPDMAEDFHHFVTDKRAPKLTNLNYSVLALGDKSYKLFCQAGVDIDSAFSGLGAKSMISLVKCDVDYEDKAEEWMDNLLQKLEPAAVTITNGKEVVKKSAVIYSKKNPFKATVLEKVKITGRESDKEVYHLELSLEGSGITYEPGDALGIITQNPKALVEQILRATEINPSETIKLDDKNYKIVDALLNQLEVTIINRETIQNYYDMTGNESIAELLNDENRLDEYIFGHDFLDLLEDFPNKWKAQDLADILRRLPPRLYSISSSQENVGEEVHITVSVVHYKHKNRLRFGACSSFLSHNLEIGDEVPVYIEKNPSFRLPANGSPIIMVGAGTGIAPYRAFMQHRESLGIKGKSWLFFGDRRFSADFLYQLEWQKLLKSKHLMKMEVAFSRDQQEKVYIQHKLLENKKEVFNWIQQGAYFYLCGDRKKLATDVQKTLLEICQLEGGMTTEQAESYVKQLKREKRVQFDVY